MGVSLGLEVEMSCVFQLLGLSLILEFSMRDVPIVSDFTSYRDFRW